MNGELLAELGRSLEAEKLFLLATVVEGAGEAADWVGRQLLVWPSGEVKGDLGAPRLNQRVALAADQIFGPLKSRRKTFDTPDGSADLFLEVFPPPPKLIVIGAVHVAIPLINYAKSHGFRTVVIDPRTTFATPERFAEADELYSEWPEDVLPRIAITENTYFAFLSHDPKIDLPALKIALPSRARYLGALGSKKTHAKRVSALIDEGLSKSQVDRMHNPIGLNLGGRRAEEIALSIMAEIVAVRYGIGV